MKITYLVLTLFCIAGVFATEGITEETVSITINQSVRTVDGVDYPSYTMQGYGKNWKDVGGIMGYSIPENQKFSVVYSNNLTEETIIHAHGQLPPSNLDGVPYISALPIQPGRSQFYEYTLAPEVSEGTYFLHSHYGFQYGNGLVAPLIVEGQPPQGYPLYQEIVSSNDVVLLLEDLCPSTASSYAIKLEEGIRDGTATPREDINRQADAPVSDCSSWATFLELAYDFSSTWYPNGFECPLPATDSDVVYQNVLANGKTYQSPMIIPKQDFSAPIRVRVINAGGMTNFQVQFPFSVDLIETDGQWIVPYSDTSFWIGVSQRLDFLIQVPASYSNNYINIISWSENYDESTPAPIILSSLNSISSSERQTLYSNLKNEISSGYASGMMNNQLDFNIHSYNPLPSRSREKVFVLQLTGDNGFRGINHYSYRLPPTAPLPFESNPHPLLVEYGDRVEFIIQNQNPDGHPMHLHGHTFQIVNIDGQKLNNGPTRDVAFVPGGCRNITIQFDALNPGVWPFHCHLEFHLAAGMLTTVEYSV